MWDRFHFRGTMVPILGQVQNLEPQNRFLGLVLPSLHYITFTWFKSVVLFGRPTLTTTSSSTVLKQRNLELSPKVAHFSAFISHIQHLHQACKTRVENKGQCKGQN